MGLTAVIAGFVVALPACGDSSGGTASDSNSGSQSSTGTTSGTTTGDTEPTGGASMTGGTTGAEGGMSESQSGTTGAEGGMSESLSGTVSSGVESDSMSGGETTASTGMISGTGGETSTTGGESSTGEPVDCGSFDNEADCVAADCMAISGRKFVSDDAMFCLDPPSFLACTEQALCAQVITTACKGQVKYQLPNACMPDDFMPCDPPADPDMDGYADCQ